MKILRHKILTFLVLCGALIQPVAFTTAYAGSLAGYLTQVRSKNLFSQSSGGIYETQDAGYRAALGGTYIFPGEAQVGITAGYQFDFSASCMGMDFNAEAFANLKLSKIIDWLKQLLTSPVFIYTIAMSAASPEIKGALNDARDIGQTYSKLLQSPCEMANQFSKDVDKKGLRGFGECAQTGLSNLFSSSSTESYRDCINKPPITADPSTKENAMDICTKAFGMTAIEKTLLKSIIGDTGWTRKNAGNLDIKGIKPVKLVKDYETVFKDKEAKFLIIINKIINAPPGQNANISTADRSEMSGPGMSLYAKDIRALKIVSTEYPGSQKQISEALAEAMAIGEFKYATQKLADLLTQCQAAEGLDTSVKESMKNITVQLVEFISTLDRSKTSAKIDKQNITTEMYKTANDVIKMRTKNNKQRISTFGN